MQHLEIKNMQDEIDYEMTSLYLKQVRMAAIYVFCLVTYISISFLSVTELKNIVIWVCIILSVYVYSIYIALPFKRELPSYEIGFYQNRQNFLHIIKGLTWGSSFYFLLGEDHPEIYDYRLIAAISCVITLSASAISASWRGMIYFIVSLALATALHFYVHIDHLAWWFLGLLGAVVVTLYLGKLGNQFMLGQIENKLLNASYIDELRAQKDKIELINQDFVKRNIELQDMQNRLQLLASHDELTGLPNRRFVLARIEEKLPEVQRHQLNFCLAIMDIDHFKQVNDVFGHAAGDDVLRKTSEILTRGLRQGDMVARYGGEEFLILLPMTELSSAQLLLERLRVELEKQAFKFDGEKLTVTASFGLTQHSPQDTADKMIDRADKMIDRADKALYQAKTAGRNRIEFVV